jgi:hypothetical protein
MPSRVDLCDSSFVYPLVSELTATPTTRSSPPPFCQEISFVLRAMLFKGNVDRAQNDDEPTTQARRDARASARNCA